MFTCVFVHLSASARVRLYALNAEVSVCVLARVCVRMCVRVRVFVRACTCIISNVCSFETSCVRAYMSRLRVSICVHPSIRFVCLRELSCN